MFDFTARVGSLFAEIFGGDVPQDPLRNHQIAARAFVVYIIGLAVVRLGKSRLISRVSSMDVLLGFILGSLLSRGITGRASISGTAISSAVLVGAHWLISLVACRWHAFGSLVKGHASLLVENGQPNHENMLRSHISDHDLIEELRLKGIEDSKRVRLAYKERNGEVSVIEREP